MFSFFLVLFIHWSPVTYWASTDLRSSSFSVIYLLAISYCSWDFQGKNTEVVCHCLPQWTTFFQNILQNFPCMQCLSQCLLPWSRPLPTHTSTGDSWTLTEKFVSVSFGVTAPFPWVLVHRRFCLCPPRVCFPSPVLSSTIKSHCLPKSNFLGVLSPFARSPCWEVCCGS